MDRGQLGKLVHFAGNREREKKWYKIKYIFNFTVRGSYILNFLVMFCELGKFSHLITHVVRYAFALFQVCNAVLKVGEVEIFIPKNIQYLLGSSLTAFNANPDEKNSK